MSRTTTLLSRPLLFFACLGVFGASSPSLGRAENPPPAAPQATAAAPKAPRPLETLPPGWEQAFATLSQDPRPPQLVRDTHYVVSNEDNHFVWQNLIWDRGGVYVGVGTDQNYVMAGWARPALMVLLDFDQVVVDLHRVYRLMFLHAKTPQEFLELWDEKHTKFIEDLIAAEKDAPTRAGMLRAYRTAHYSIPRRLHKLESMYKPQGVRWFMNDPVQFSYLVEMFKNNRVIMVRGDLSVGGSLASVGAAAHKVGAVVRTLYLSNAERYFPYTPGFRQSILSLPIDERSMLLRTRGRMNGSYEYIAQDLPNFQRWMEWGKASYAVEITRYREPEFAGSLAYVIRRLPPAPKSSLAEPQAAPIKLSGTPTAQPTQPLHAAP